MGDFSPAEVRYLVVDDWKAVTESTYNEWGQESEVWASEKMPEPFRSALNKVLERVDDATCDMSHVIVKDHGPLCSNPVGWVLYEDDEYPMRGGLQWRCTTLVQVRYGVVAVCEDCDPVMLYGEAVAADD